MGYAVDSHITITGDRATGNERVPSLRPLDWAGEGAKREFKDLPEDIQRSFGWSLLFVQGGETPGIAKPWKGLGSGVFELVENDPAGTYRCVYVAKFEKAVYVLHSFQKKSTHGIKTSKQTVDLVEKRFKAAEADYQAHYGKEIG